MTWGASGVPTAIERIGMRQHDGVQVLEQRRLEHGVHLQRRGVPAGGELHAQPSALLGRAGRGHRDGQHRGGQRRTGCGTEEMTSRQ